MTSPAPPTVRRTMSGRSLARTRPIRPRATTMASATRRSWGAPAATVVALGAPSWGREGPAMSVTLAGDDGWRRAHYDGPFRGSYVGGVRDVAARGARRRRRRQHTRGGEARPRGGRRVAGEHRHQRARGGTAGGPGSPRRGA